MGSWFKMETRNKMQTEAQLKLSHRLIRDIFSTGNCKMKSKPFNAKSWNVISKKFINQLSNSQIFGFHLFDDVTVKASDNCPTNCGKRIWCAQLKV